MVDNKYAEGSPSHGLGYQVSYPPTIDHSMDLDFPTKTTTEPVLARPAQNTTRSYPDVVDTDPNFLENFLLANEREVENDKSPLERFKPKNKQVLSVTDLASMAWCELQTFYQLRTGKRRLATPAMKQGTKIHKALEEQVMKPVIVETEKKHDRWALRFMNVLQGLKTLRETGITRELEVWGVIGGQTVNGVIDQLSYYCPDEYLETRLSRQARDAYPLPKTDKSDQKTIPDHLKTQSIGASSESTMGGTSFPATQDSLVTAYENKDARKVYITDVKTLSTSRLPSDAAFRGTKMQLMLYHTLVTQMATDSVDFELLASAYHLDTKATFSDSFTASMAGMMGVILPEAGPDNPEHGYSDVSKIQEPRDLDTRTILQEHNNLSLLWSLMIREFQKTFPNGKDSLGRLLNAEFRNISITSTAGKVVGYKVFPMSEHVLDMYTEHQMRWWRGERKSVGVLVEDGWKCGFCDFAAGCEWRKERKEEFSALAAGKRRSQSSAAKVIGKEPAKRRRKKKVVEVQSETESDLAEVSDEEKGKKSAKKRGRRKTKLEVEVRNKGEGESESDVMAGVPKEQPAKRARRKNKIIEQAEVESEGMSASDILEVDKNKDGKDKVTRGGVVKKKIPAVVERSRK